MRCTFVKFTFLLKDPQIPKIGERFFKHRASIQIFNLFWSTGTI